MTQCIIERSKVKEQKLSKKIQKRTNISFKNINLLSFVTNYKYFKASVHFGNKKLQNIYIFE